MRRKHLPLKTKLASALLALGDIPYDHAKEMTADQLISLYHFDHGMLHESGHPQRDMYWNITPRLIKAHRVKTRQDAAIVAKGRRIRRKLRLGPDGKYQTHTGSAAVIHPARTFKRKLRSRGFDKTRRRRMDGTVEKR